MTMPCDCGLQTSLPFQISSPGNANLFDSSTGKFLKSWDTGHLFIADCFRLNEDDEIAVAGLFDTGARKASGWGVGGVCRFDSLKRRVWDAAVPRMEAISGYNWVDPSFNWMSPGYESWQFWIFDNTGRAYVRRQSPGGTYYFCRIGTDGAETPTNWIDPENGRVWPSRFSSSALVTNGLGSGPNTLASHGDDGSLNWSVNLTRAPSCVDMEPSGSAWVLSSMYLFPPNTLSKYGSGGLISSINLNAVPKVGLGIVLSVVGDNDVILFGKASSGFGSSISLTRFQGGAVLWTVSSYDGDKLLDSSFFPNQVQIDFDLSINAIFLLANDSNSRSSVVQLDLSTGAFVRSYDRYKILMASCLHAAHGKLLIGGVRTSTNVTATYASHVAAIMPPMQASAGVVTT